MNAPVGGKKGETPLRQSERRGVLSEGGSMPLILSEVRSFDIYIY